MNKTTKGALAATAAAALLLGGAGTLAYWTDDATVDGGDITSGRLTLDDGTCGVWTHTNGPKATQAVVKIVPGDILRKTCTFVIDAKGDNLKATLDTDESVELYTTNKAASSLSLPVDWTYTLNGAAFPDTGVITENAANQTLVATVEVQFPFGDAETVANGKNKNDTQDLIVSLDDLKVSLTQLVNTATS